MGEFEELTPDEARLASQVREQLRAGDGLDDAGRSRLAAARARALEAATPRRSGPLLAAAGSLAAAAVLAVLIFMPQRESAEIQAFDALEVATDEFEPEFYEDLDLYRWIDEAGAGRV
ncbi:MAG: hypothetical protein RL030_2027 [Pseudomonadota bacterium]|jgi:hypothetical protein